jgi:hypothetical protein
LLTGLVFDDHGIRLTPSHTKKGARRYRYYIHPIEIQDGSRPTLRIPAQELEAAVVDALGGFLRDESRLMGTMAGVNTELARSRLKDAGALAARLEAASVSHRIDMLKRLVARVNGKRPAAAP